MLIKAGTYRFNDVLTAPVGGVACQLRFLTNFMGYDGVLCTEMQVGEYPELGFYVVSAPEELLEIVHAYGMALPRNLWVYSDGWNSFYGDGVKTVTIAEEQEVSDEFYAWFTANAVEQKEISGKWKFKDELTRDLRYGEYVVNFSFISEKSGYLINCQADRFTIENTTEGTGAFRMHYTIISMNPDLGASLPLVANAYSYYPEISDSGWLNSYGEGIKTIDFGTEPQTVSAEFYNWLTANAVPVMASITHNGSTIAELFPGQTATLKCKGMKMEDDVVVAVGELPETEMPEPKLQEKTATENGEVLPDEGYDGLSKVTVAVEGEVVEDYDGTITIV